MPSFLARVNRQRFCMFDVTVYEADGVTLAPLATGDIAVVRIGHGSTTDLEVRSGQVTDGDSTATVTNGSAVVRVKIGMMDAQELPLPIYSCDIFVIDASDLDAAGSPRHKHCETGVMHVAGTLPEPPELQSSSSGESSAS